MCRELKVARYGRARHRAGGYSFRPMCIPREALVSALVGRARDGYRVSAADIAALLGAGVAPEQLAQAFAGEGEALEHARAVIRRAERVPSTIAR